MQPGPQRPALAAVEGQQHRTHHIGVLVSNLPKFGIRTVVAAVIHRYDLEAYPLPQQSANRLDVGAGTTRQPVAGHDHAQQAVRP